MKQVNSDWCHWWRGSGGSVVVVKNDIVDNDTKGKGKSKRSKSRESGLGLCSCSRGCATTTQGYLIIRLPIFACFN
eukprot:scaffold9252_cov160-Skeletonema_marinoi.AAC.24